ncbi:hypothetical protein F5877DRAFT_84352 [Lentinula edodes]|nr:hypothetical protein F5877DRAFT_84352 [Lentinula edodes]
MVPYLDLSVIIWDQPASVLLSRSASLLCLVTPLSCSVSHSAFAASYDSMRHMGRMDHPFLCPLPFVFLHFLSHFLVKLQLHLLITPPPPHQTPPPPPHQTPPPPPLPLPCPPPNPNPNSKPHLNTSTQHPAPPSAYS